MAQLSDDCFSARQPLMTAAEALTLIEERVVCIVGTEQVALDGAVDRILAEDVVSPIDVPPHDNSAVDGYAVYYDDLDRERPTSLPVTGRATAGHPLKHPARRGEAVRIFTGAPMPTGPDTVMMQEDCEERGGRVTIAPGIKRGANRRSAGEDVQAGAIVLRSGCRLRPQEIGLAASVGRTHLMVRCPLRAGVFSTGDEIGEPGAPLRSGAVYDANRFTLKAALRQLGCAVTDFGILPDTLDTIREAVAAASSQVDVLLTSGGMSVGEEDHVRTAVEHLGRLDFWMLAIKPGRPVALGQIDTSRGPVPLIGLPGNPGAVIVTFLLVARPLLLKLMGATAHPPHRFQVRSAFDYKKKRDRREFVRARLSRGRDGIAVAEKYGPSGAGILSSLVGADGLVELPEDLTYLEKDGLVDFLPFSEVCR